MFLIFPQKREKKNTQHTVENMRRQNMTHIWGQSKHIINKKAVMHKWEKIILLRCLLGKDPLKMWVRKPKTHNKSFSVQIFWTFRIVWLNLGTYRDTGTEATTFSFLIWWARLTNEAYDQQVKVTNWAHSNEIASLGKKIYSMRSLSKRKCKDIPPRCGWVCQIGQQR